MRLKVNVKKRKAELEIKTPKVKETLGWLTDDRKMECEGRTEQGKQEGNKPTSSHYCRDLRSKPFKRQ